MAFILRDKKRGSECYLGKTYVFQGETYAATCNKKHAKRYTTRKRAERAAEILDRKVWNYSFEVVEVKDIDPTEPLSKARPTKPIQSHPGGKDNNDK